MSEARRFVVRALSHCCSETVDTACLLTSELVTNAILHAHSDLDVLVSESVGQVRVAITDDNSEMPAFLSLRASQHFGRGLQLLDELADSWGVVERRPGKTIWFALRCDRPTTPPG